MSEAIDRFDELRPLLDKLTREERGDVVQYLLHLDLGDDDLTEEEHWAYWKPELERRLHQLETEGSNGMPWSEFEKILKEKYG